MNSPTLLGGEDIELIEEFCSVIPTDGGTDKDISVRIGKARYAFRTLQPVRLSRQLSLNTKLWILVLGLARLGMHLGPYTTSVTLKAALSKHQAQDISVGIGKARYALRA